MSAPKSVFESLSPFFQVGDITAALDFYCDSLGFKPGWLWGEPPTHANVCRDAISISMTSKPSIPPAVGNISIQLTHVEAYYAELHARGVKTGPLVKSDYGMLDFSLVDPWGNR